MMVYRWRYRTPDGFDDIIMNSDGECLTALCFEHSRDEGRKAVIECKEKPLPIFRETERWLDLYFCGKQPNFTPRYRIGGMTPFRKRVFVIMRKIPYGETVTYREIAEEVAAECGKEKMSAQAVGGAVGFNPICIIVPCHRVVGAGGALIGYGGGVANKRSLLALEGG